jgi:hypothetical protein
MTRPYRERHRVTIASARAHRVITTDDDNSDM